MYVEEKDASRGINQPIVMGIDTIRWIVPKDGLMTWLKSHNLTLEKYGNTPYKSRNLQSKVDNGKYRYVGVIHFGTYPYSLNETIVVTMSNELAKRKKSKYYRIELAGLHQPHKKNISQITYQMIANLNKKYRIQEVDLAIDFESMCRVKKKTIIDVFGHKAPNVRTQYETTFYFKGIGSNDVVLYNKSDKILASNDKHKIDGYGDAYNFHWLRLEIPFDLKLPTVTETGIVLFHKVQNYNRKFLEFINDFAHEAILGQYINKLQSVVKTILSFSFLDRQIIRMTDNRCKLPFY